MLHSFLIQIQKVDINLSFKTFKKVFLTITCIFSEFIGVYYKNTGSFEMRTRNMSNFGHLASLLRYEGVWGWMSKSTFQSQPNPL